MTAPDSRPPVHSAESAPQASVELVADVLLRLARITGQASPVPGAWVPPDGPAQLDAALAARVRRPLIQYLAIHEDDARRMFDTAIQTCSGVSGLLDGMQRLPGPPADVDAVVRLRWGQDTLAMALLPPQLRADAPARLAQLKRALGPSAVALNAPELHRLLRYLPAGPAWEGLMDRLPASLPELLAQANAVAESSG
jgi:hypothetical protein